MFMFKKISLFYRKFKANLQLNEAIRQADAAHAATHERYFVMPGANGKLIIMDRFNFRRLRMKHYIGNNVNISDLFRECFYHTPNRAEKDALPAEESYRKHAAFFQWKEAQRKTNRKNGKV